jgi:hypothetical protein
MINGLWAVTFRSDVDLSGGVAVINNGRILGGDSSFTYVGQLKEKGDGTVTGSVEVTRFNSLLPAVIPGADFYTLMFSGKIDDKSLDFTGNAEGQGALNIIGSKAAPL